MNVELAVMETLWEKWCNEPPKIPKAGNRIFVRWVCLDPNNLGWDDWLLVGTITEEGKVLWLDKNNVEKTPIAEIIRGGVEIGNRHGLVPSDNGGGLEWGLFHGDGPEEPRVSDWASP